MDQPSITKSRAGSVVRWVSGAAAAYLAATWGSLVVIWWTAGPVPTLDPTRPGAALVALVLVVAGSSFIGRGTAGLGGALAGAASAYALAIITALRAAERNWGFIAPGPAGAWQAGVTEALVRSLLVLGAAALVGALARELRERRRRTHVDPGWPSLPLGRSGLAIAVLVWIVAVGGTSALIAAAAETSIVLPAPVPTVTATGRGALVTVEPASRAPGEVRIVTDSDAHAACELCAGGLEFFGPLSDAELTRLRVEAIMDDSISRLPRPDQLWYGGVSLREGRHAFAHLSVAGPDEPLRLIGVGILTVSAGPTPAVVARTPGDAPQFAGVERLVLVLHGAAVGLVVSRRPRIARLAGPQRWLASAGLAAVGSFALAGGLAIYVSFAGSPF